MSSRSTILCDHLAVLVADPCRGLEGRSAAAAAARDRLRLLVGKVVAVFLDAEVRASPSGRELPADVWPGYVSIGRWFTERLHDIRARKGRRAPTQSPRSRLTPESRPSLIEIDHLVDRWKERPPRGFST